MSLTPKSSFALWQILAPAVSRVFAWLIFACVIQSGSTAVAVDPPKTLNGLPLLFFDDFESGDSKQWQPTDGKAWRVRKRDDNHICSLTARRGRYRPPFLSPYNLSLNNSVPVGSFVLDVKLQSTSEDYGHRDLCLFFGYQDPSHFYYVHFGKKTGEFANQVFIVNGKPRAKISSNTSPGTDWDDEWHHARVVREVRSGQISVYFDNMQVPVMTATDKTFLSGPIGIGSFDDTGNFDDVVLYGEKLEPPAAKSDVP